MALDLEAKVDQIHEMVTQLIGMVANMNQRMNTMEARMDSMETRIKTIGAEVKYLRLEVIERLDLQRTQIAKNTEDVRILEKEMRCRQTS